MTNKKSTLNFFNKIDSFLAKEKLPLSKKKIVLAVSGGPDSMAMTDYFLKKKMSFCVAHFNHKLRGEDSNKDENFLNRFCRNNSVEFFSESFDISAFAGKMKMSIEQAARKKRYEFLISIAKKNASSFICTAHHLDDNAETFLLNLLRGTNIKGLTAIPAKRKLSKSIFVIRPMLAVSRREIMEYVKNNRILFRKDKSNEDEKFTRNWIRKTLIPLMEKKQPKIKEHLVAFSSKLSEIL